MTINKPIEPEGQKDAVVNASHPALPAVAQIAQIAHTVIDALGKRIEDLPPGRTLDAIQILGLGSASDEALPNANPGEIVIRSSGLSLPELGEKYPNLFLQKPRELVDWSSEKLPTGTLVLRLGSKIFNGQEVLLDGKPAPVALAATAVLAIHLSGGEDPLGENGFAICKEQIKGHPIHLGWCNGKLYLSTDYREPNIDYFPTRPKIDA